MKKYIGIAVAVLMVLGLSGMAMAIPQLTDNQTFTFTTTVDKYIECNGNKSLLIANPVIPDGGVAIPNAPPAAYVFSEIAYANCPYKLTLSGNNDAGDNLPILARQEDGQTRFDRLITSIGLQIPGTPVNISFYSDPDGADTGIWNGNPSNCPVPHDGEVGAILYLGAALPHETPEFGVDNTWNESADAGDYTCTLTFTYLAL